MISVLYVDDDPDIQEIAMMAFSLDPELAVRTASSGVEALSILDSGMTPDLLLLDMMMPGMDGPATLAAIRERSRLADIPAVFFTARARAGEHEAIAALGAAGVIAKPFDPMMLAAELRVFATGGPP
ncbi:response regulator [Sphingomonas xinjiangensis]|uniref:CheY-like chemotaxis protein n=1 Tax=Sphingomonas xinjiangensis TaxID=643568 RepID=A0A840YMH2_9SPHN|nr:response regulator [Sphingomonas xinjiangensis]MBB5711036.1 CheY-like chemotaxis protein [Sphingomonas xinjiangensis]